MGGTCSALSILLLLTLAACAPTLTQIRGLPLAGESFFETLAREQRRTAVNLGRQGASLPAAERFAARAAEARAGRISDLEPATDPDTAAARAEILALLDTPARQRCPVFAALALARYDAWADRAAVWPTSEETLRLRSDTLKNRDVLKGACAS